MDSQETAEDITSKVFLRGFEAYQKQQSTIKNVGAFLYQIARNAVIDYYREKGRTKVVSTSDSPQIVDPTESAHDKAILSADINVIKKSIQKLKKEQQDIIIWHYLEDMPIANIAQLVGKPEGTVRVMLHRGLKELKDLVQEV